MLPFFVCLLRQGLYAACLQLTLQPRLALNLQSSCLNLLVLGLQVSITMPDEMLYFQ